MGIHRLSNFVVRSSGTLSSCPFLGMSAMGRWRPVRVESGRSHLVIPAKVGIPLPSRVECFEEVVPVGIGAFDQLDLPGAVPFLDCLLPGNRLFDRWSLLRVPLDWARDGNWWPGSRVYSPNWAIASSQASSEQRTRSTPELLPARTLPPSSISTSIVIGSAPSSAGGPDFTL